MAKKGYILYAFSHNNSFEYKSLISQWEQNKSIEFNYYIER
jgi:hypothetical protein